MKKKNTKHKQEENSRQKCFLSRDFETFSIFSFSSTFPVHYGLRSLSRTRYAFRPFRSKLKNKKKKKNKIKKNM